MDGEWSAGNWRGKEEEGAAGSYLRGPGPRVGKKKEPDPRPEGKTWGWEEKER